MQVKLLAKTDKEPLALASHAARICYTLDEALIDKPIDVKTRLFDSGHHTTLQHTNFTFYIQDIPVSSVVFGLHLASPYYNSDQRSGRFSKMYESPDFEVIRQMLTPFYLSVDVETVLPWIEKGIRIYQEWLPKLIPLAEEAIRQERPFANDKYIALNAPKFAQEQLRMFISEVMPTALDMTINLSALTALWRSAWTPEMRAITDAMVTEVISVYPELKNFFASEARSHEDWFVPFLMTQAFCSEKPTLHVVMTDIRENDLCLEMGKDSVDTLYFRPNAMNNNIHFVKTRVNVSCATYGQDQRHRSIKRSQPSFTGGFYVPPLLVKAGLTSLAITYMQEWLDLRNKVAPGLVQAIAPYGAMVSYEKMADLNALIHEQGKRSCWCAGEEIYHLAIALREAFKTTGEANKLLRVLAPPCLLTGRCQEGVRYCGRDFKGTTKENYFPKRQV